MGKGKKPFVSDQPKSRFMQSVINKELYVIWDNRVATNLENMENLENSGNFINCQNLRENAGKFEFL